MPARAQAPVEDCQRDHWSPTLTRRQALLGAAALIAPVGPKLALADALPAPVAATGPILLNGNENPYGPSPAARQAILASVPAAPRYAEASIEDLRRLLAAREGVDANQLVIGSGSGELLRMAGLLALTSARDAELIASRPTYEELPDFATRLGLPVQWIAPDAAHRHDLPAMRRALTARTRLLYVCNPNNPTGAAVTRDALAAFVRSVPAQVTVVVDEAYMDFADGAGVASVSSLVREVPNLVVLKTFSKIHGLAGLRIGYGIISPALATSYGSLTLVWPNTTGIAAALASCNDRAFLETTRAAILADRERVHAALDRLGLQRTSSQGNFVFFDTGAPIERFQQRMLARGIRVGRRFAGYDTWSRVTVGTREEMDRFLAELPPALAG
jgi:histidinol-phosphate aminotransferase